jgi:hypothetical protein
MRGASLFIGLLVVVGVGYFVWQRSATSLPGGGPPQQQIDVVAIRQRLLTIAQTERQYQAAHGAYATLDELREDNLLPGGSELRGYRFTGSPSAEGFTITATPIDPNKPGWPTLEVGDTMEIRER